MQDTAAAESFEKWRLFISVKEISELIFVWLIFKKKKKMREKRKLIQNKNNSDHLNISLSRNILELIEFFEDNNCFYLVFEKLRGGKCE